MKGWRRGPIGGQHDSKKGHNHTEFNMKDKFGLVTFYNYNFGSILQCYATKTVLERMGLEVEVIDEVREKELPPSLIEKIIGHTTATLKDPGYLMKKIKNRKRRNPLAPGTATRMNEFVQKEFNPQFMKWEQLVDYAKGLKACIVGSDQVWNFSVNYDHFYALEFVPPEKRISYGVSLGVEKADEEFISRLRYVAAQFEEISVREETGKVILERCCGKPIIRVADPTFFLTGEEWRAFSSERAVKYSGYILAHFLDYPSAVAIGKLKETAEQTGKKVIFIGYHYDLIEKKKWIYEDCGPKDYVAYISQADYIFTDSYHTSIFSVNLEKQFYVFQRMYLHDKPQASRITDVLALYGLSNRYITSYDCELPTDYRNVGAQIQEERERAISYLRSQIRKRIM